MCKPTKSFFSYTDMAPFTGDSKTEADLTVARWCVGAPGQGFPPGIGRTGWRMSWVCSSLAQFTRFQRRAWFLLSLAT